MNRSVLLMLAVSLLALSLSAQAQFSSGSTGAQGVFPPAALGTNFDALTLDMKTGIVTAFRNGVSVGTATFPGGASTGDAFPTGEFNFTTFTLIFGSSFTAAPLQFVPNTLNTPVTILATGDV